jgi:cell division protein FtsI/penicillin-binding protein 2
MEETGEQSVAPPSVSLDFARKRSLAIVFIFGFWGLLVVGRLAQIMIFARDRYLVEMTQSSWEQGVVPAMRGRILDVDGRQLAWSTRHFELAWHVPADEVDAWNQWQQIAAALGESAPALDPTRLPMLAERTLVLQRDITPAQADAWRDTIEAMTLLQLRPYFRRHNHPHRRIRQLIGQVVTVEGMEVGAEGAELTHDSLLRGRPGLYRVMLGPDRKWLPETWEVIREMQPGYDVYLPVRVPESRLSVP